MSLLKRYKANMIREAARKARYYEAKAVIAVNYHHHKLAHIYYRKAQIQYRRLKGLLTDIKCIEPKQSQKPPQN